jgi:glutaredoxin
MGRSSYYLVFGLSNCPFCKEADNLLGSLGYDYEYFTLDNDPEYLLEMKEFYKHRTVPIVLKVGDDSIVRFIGGCDDLKRELND